MYQSIFLQVKIEINDFVLHMVFISFTYALKTYRLINSCNFSTHKVGRIQILLNGLIQRALAVWGSKI